MKSSNLPARGIIATSHRLSITLKVWKGLELRMMVLSAFCLVHKGWDLSAEAWENKNKRQMGSRPVMSTNWIKSFYAKFSRYVLIFMFFIRYVDEPK